MAVVELTGADGAVASTSGSTISCVLAEAVPDAVAAVDLPAAEPESAQVSPEKRPSVMAQSSPESSIEPAAESTPGQTVATGVAAIEVTHGGALAVRWVGLIDQIGLSGMTYNIAANASLLSVEEHCWSFALTQQQIHLFNATHQQRLARALSEHLGSTITVAVVEAPAQGETPAQYQQRKRQERQAQAVQAIEGDPDVQAIIASYNAVIDPASIKPIHDGEPVR
jgi:DNA polymerase-3 subunit gamma/tau